MSELKSKIGCGKPIKGTCDPYNNGHYVTLNVNCGGLLGDEGEYYCDKCQALIDELENDSDE